MNSTNSNAPTDTFNVLGLGAGGLITAAGILVMIFGSTFLGLILLLVGLVGFGGFVKGKWY